MQSEEKQLELAVELMYDLLLGTKIMIIITAVLALVWLYRAIRYELKNPEEQVDDMVKHVIKYKQKESKYEIGKIHSVIIFIISILSGLGAIYLIFQNKSGVYNFKILLLLIVTFSGALVQYRKNKYLKSK